MKIIIADDKEENLYILDYLLKANGYQTVIARNGKEALELAKKESPNLIVSDVLMPVMDGFALCMEWKKDKILKNIPFVFYTATYKDKSDEKFALSLGADRFLLKPQDPIEFIEIIKELLENVNQIKEEVKKPKVEKEAVILKEYNQRLISKLEDKLIQTKAAEIELTKKNEALKLMLEELKKNEEEILKLATAVDQSPAVIVITDTEGVIEYVNPKFTEITGYTFDETVGKKPNILKSGKHSVALYKELWDTVKSGNEWHGEMINKKKNGELFWEAVSISPILNNESKVVNFLKVARDITQTKQYEIELKLALEKAEESNRLKSAFLANVSHEIHTPMNGILGFADLLKNPELSTERQAKYVDIIINSGNRMLSLINQLMDISKIESGIEILNIEEIDITKEVKNVYNLFKPEATKKGLEFSLIMSNLEDLNIYTDRYKLYAILVNLVKNAIKYTPTGFVEFGFEKENGLVQFFVKDSGIGIPKNRFEAIFDRFVQADIEDRDAYEGVGLGLSIAKSYAEMLGGKIWLNSDTNGSQFYFTVENKKNN